MSNTTSFTSALGPTFRRYLELKHALGRKCAAERAMLKHLDTFLAAADADFQLDDGRFRLGFFLRHTVVHGQHRQEFLGVGQQFKGFSAWNANFETAIK